MKVSPPGEAERGLSMLNSRRPTEIKTLIAICFDHIFHLLFSETRKVKILKMLSHHATWSDIWKRFSEDRFPSSKSWADQGIVA